MEPPKIIWVIIEAPIVRVHVQEFRVVYLKLPFFCGVPINSVLGFMIRTYKNVGYGSLR